jgi:glycerophosphoryl diester phosphodiesterase
VVPCAPERGRYGAVVAIPSGQHPYLDHRGTIALAHRGGAAEAPENSLTSFAHARDLGYVYVETDVRATRDGVLVVHHDDTLDRTTDGEGLVADHDWEQVRQARGAGGDQVMSLLEALERFPTLRLNIDLKDDSTVAPFLALVADSPGLLDRVCVASFSGSRLARVRSALGPRLATSAGPAEVARSVLRRRGVPLPVASAPVALQVPARLRGLTVVDPALVQRAHRAGLQVHVWTVDEAAEMERLLDMGVDGIVTDRPTVLREVLQRRGRWAGGR